MNYKTFPIFLAFLCMGFGDAVNTFVGPAKDHFSLSNFESSLITSAGYIMFGLLSVPMGIFQDKRGRKTTLMIGLTIALVGILTVMFFGLNQYVVFLLSILLLGCGATILQVAGNPIMRDVSEEGKYSSNLSLGQFIKAIGSFTAPMVFFVAKLAGYTETQSWNVLFPIFAVAVIISIISVATLKVEQKSDQGGKPASIGSCLRLLKHPLVFASVLSIFLYVGAETCIASGAPVYFSELFGVDKALATKYVMYFFITIMAGRFAGAILLRKVSPRTFLVWTCLLSLVGFLLFALTYGFNLSVLTDHRELIGTTALVVLALGYANIFPLVFSIAIDRMPEKSNELSGLMVSAICGGAFLFPLMGWIGDRTGNLLFGFIVPLLAVVYILAAAVTTTQTRKI